MPIRINLLAEQQAAEEMRRRDPVKRGIYVGALLVVAMLAWSGQTQLAVMGARGRLATEEGRLQRVEKPAKEVGISRQQTGQVEDKLAALFRLGTNRFLWGPPLDALQRAILPNVHITRLAGAQSYTFKEGVRYVTNGVAKTTPSITTERVAVTIEARDYGQQSDQNILKFRKIIEDIPYFKANLATNGVNLVSFTEPQPDEADRTRSFVSFTLECRYPERARTAK